MPNDDWSMLIEFNCSCVLFCTNKDVNNLFWMSKPFIGFLNHGLEEKVQAENVYDSNGMMTHSNANLNLHAF